uniref:Uncharacterized protein n=1 Tax=Lupinus angustifolius TaxID=3871 RepID=L0P0X2_LUPAN|nr:hypothetical protein [Lupinus angustifolius]
MGLVLFVFTKMEKEATKAKLVGVGREKSDRKRVTCVVRLLTAVLGVPPSRASSSFSSSVCFVQDMHVNIFTTYPFSLLPTQQLNRHALMVN